MIRVAKQEEVKHFDIKDLDANIQPYVVFGNEEHNPSFMPNKHSMEHLSVMAIVCGGQLHYGIWGDTSGGKLVAGLGSAGSKSSIKASTSSSTRSVQTATTTSTKSPTSSSAPAGTSKACRTD
ncbi:hypothetical protein N7527_001807 [Penicillium freii]|nr:hypothetical protein N7527_001807 [Penicillium freii]